MSTRRGDTLLVVVVGAFAVFVGAQVMRSREARRNAHAATPGHIVKSDDHATSVGVSSAREALERPAGGAPTSTPLGPAQPERDPRRDIAGTYFSDMVADLRGQLVRWPDRRQQGLRVWVQSSSTIRDWNVGYAQMARDAFDDWGAVGLPLRFDFILDSASADIRIVWNERFPQELGQRVGNTRRAADQNGWLTSAEIAVAIHDSTDHAIPPSALAGIVRHEAGHALGLGHSNDPKTKMYPTEMTADITTADRATLKLLYEFPPGPVR